MKKSILLIVMLSIFVFSFGNKAITTNHLENSSSKIQLVEETSFDLKSISIKYYSGGAGEKEGDSCTITIESSVGLGETYAKISVTVTRETCAEAIAEIKKTMKECKEMVKEWVKK